MPERADWAKRLFIDQVSITSKVSLYYFMWISYGHIMTSSMQALRRLRMRLFEIAPLPAETRPRAADILSLNRCQTPTPQCSLEIEVDTFLNDATTGTDPISYWQVFTDTASMKRPI
jgi:hypothetical protein